MRSHLLHTAIILLSTIFAAQALAAPENRQLLFGDTHLHTSWSPDASLLGNRSADPDTAYRFAKGLPVIHPGHRARVRIKTPLDFLAVSDHGHLVLAEANPKAYKELSRTKAVDGKCWSTPVLANGHIEPRIASIQSGQSWMQRAQAFRNMGAHARGRGFVEWPADSIGGLATPTVGRGMACKGRHGAARC